ncbi:carbohydrate binding domain-containing protein [Subtercola boreus]|uniref:carbohydrate binding domain-containing protein n=1 Tax=Subtercola boreus TaxID=120213 RepID=UPI000E2EB7D8|nr:carbohydrate binding domain-containing protein [Subtercola boreus]
MSDSPSIHHRSRLRRAIGTLVTVVVLAAGLTAVGQTLQPESAAALSGSSFDPGNIISDATFFDSTTMSESAVQGFLTDHGSSCITSGGSTCLKDFSSATNSRAASAYCSAYTGRSSETAAQIIVRVGVACSINPQVILVMLQKEQGLVDARSTTAGQYRSALGYGCPDTAACDATYYGFFNQVYSAASQFQRYAKNSTSWSYQPGRTNNILYNPNASCGSAPVFIQNQATANLYIYTPYQPNAAALANLGGTGDACSAYGNRNFWVYFTTWFGDPTGGGLRSPSFEGGSAGWGPGNGAVNQVAYKDPAIAQNGSWFFASNTTVPGRSIAQNVQRTVEVGGQATATIWLRSATSEAATGRVALWGIGGTTEGGSTSYSVGNTWQQVTVKLPVRQSAHQTVRLEVYMDSTSTTLFMDNATLVFGQAPPLKELLSAPGFENSLGGWVKGNGEMNQAIYNDPSASHSGSWFGAVNTGTPGRSIAQQVPVATSAGGRYTFSIWVRAALPGSTYSGRLALWGLGGSAPVVSTRDFMATSKWTRVSVTTDIPPSSVTTLKPEVYLQQTSNTLYLDDGSLSRNILTAGSFEDGSFSGWGVGNGSINTAVYSSAASGVSAQNGSYFLATNTGTAGSSLKQDVARNTIVGDSYTAQVWVRPADPTKTFSGTLALWGLGGTTEVQASPFTASGSGWTHVYVTLPLAAEHQSLRFELYENTTGGTLWVDGALLY